MKLANFGGTSRPGVESTIASFRLTNSKLSNLSIGERYPFCSFDRTRRKLLRFRIVLLTNCRSLSEPDRHPYRRGRKG